MTVRDNVLIPIDHPEKDLAKAILLNGIRDHAVTTCILTCFERNRNRLSPQTGVNPGGVATNAPNRWRASRSARQVMPQPTAGIRPNLNALPIASVPVVSPRMQAFRVVQSPDTTSVLTRKPDRKIRCNNALRELVPVSRIFSRYLHWQIQSAANQLDNGKTTFPLLPRFGTGNRALMGLVRGARRSKLCARHGWSWGNHEARKLPHRDA